MTPTTSPDVLKGALHVHSTCSDGYLTPEEVLRVYRDLGFDFVALTDHDYLLRPDAYDRLPDEFEGMLVYRGVERTLFVRGYVHVNQIFGDREELHVFNHPAEYALPLEQLVHKMKETEKTFPIDVIEVTHQGFYTPEYDTEAIPYPKVASDDAHTLEGCGRARIEVPCERDRDAVLRAIKAGTSRIRYQCAAPMAEWANRGGIHRAV